VSTLIRTGLGFNGDLLVSLGRTSAVLAATAVALAVLLALGPSMMARWGIQGMAWAVCLSSLSSAIISSLVIRRQLPVRYLREIGPAALCTAAVAGAGWALAPVVDGAARFVGASLLLIVAYAILYLGLFERAGLRRAWHRAREILHQKRMSER